MDNWADLVASLRAGASPSDLLPQLRSFLNTLPPEPPKPTTSATPLSNLYHTLDPSSDDVFQVPYLRPPSSIWYMLQDTSKNTKTDRTRLFDTELDLDVLSEFSPRFIRPPPPSVCALLQRESEWTTPNQPTIWNSDAVMHIDDQSKLQKNVDATLKSSIKTHEQITYWTEKLTQLGLLAFQKRLYGDDILSDTRMSEAIDDDESVLPQFPSLSEDDWSMIVSDANVRLQIDYIIWLLTYINQTSFARVVLCTLLPCIGASVRASDVKTEQFLKAVDTAAHVANIGELHIGEIKDLLNGFTGSLGMAAQLRVLKTISWKVDLK